MVEYLKGGEKIITLMEEELRWDDEKLKNSNEPFYNCKNINFKEIKNLLVFYIWITNSGPDLLVPPTGT